MIKTLIKSRVYFKLIDSKRKEIKIKNLQMKDKGQEMGQLEDLKSKINAKNGVSNQQGFALPEDYFEKMQAEVLDKVKSKPYSSVGSIRKMWIPAAAACLLIASIFFLRNQEIHSSRTGVYAMQEEVSSEDVFDYLIENSEVVSEDVLLEMDGIEEVIESLEDEIYFNF